MQPQAPRAPQRITTVVRHGETVEDPYAWLRDPDWQQVMRDPEALNPAIRAYLEAENAYTEAMLAPTRQLQELLFAEMKGRIKEDDASVPLPDGPFLYYFRFEGGAQYPIYCRSRTERGAREEVLLDAQRESAGETFFSLAECRHSPDHRLFAYATDVIGAEDYTIHIKDLATGAVFGDRIRGAHGDFAWANDGQTLLYTALDDRHRPTKVYRHRIGDDPAADALVYEEPDPGFYLGVGRTESGRFLLIHAHDHSQTSEVRFIEANAPEGPPTLFAARRPGVEYSVSHHGDRFLIHTNADGAEDFKIATAPLTAPQPANWRDLIGHQPGRLIRSIRVYRGHLVRLERIDGLPRIVITRLADRAEHEIAFEEETFDLSIITGLEYDTTSLRFTYSSLTTPQRTYDYDMETRVRTLRKQQEVPSGHDPERYVTRRVFASSHDGEMVPISLVHAKGTAVDGMAPLLLYGYGAYGLSMPAAFGTNRLSLIDRGFVYAIAHVRGGMERGYRWYREGKLFNKKNSFLDLIAAAEHLVVQGYAAKGGIVAHGGSAGGMLVAAAANMRPDLFRAVIAEVPFVDVLNTMCDASLPLTPPEWVEWGNPIEDPEAYRYIRSYCPYDNVRAQAYPHILTTAGLSDPRVTYWEPAKWVAKLRASKSDDGFLLLKTNMEAGHRGAGGRFDKLHEVALIYAFVLLVSGLADGAAQPAPEAERHPAGAEAP